MPRQPRPGPDPSHPLASRAGVLGAQREDAGCETNVADLAARFAEQSGGALSAELSADLALEIVLNEIVEQACLATGATGAAIALRRDDEMICRASSGETAPALGTRMDSVSGLSGLCLRTGTVLRCDDALIDPRTDAASCSLLGIRSMIVLPLVRRSEVVGLFEAFSSRAAAFCDRDQQTLEALSQRVLKNLQKPAEPPKAGPLKEEPESIPKEPENGRGFGPAVFQRFERALPESFQALSHPADSHRARDIFTWALAVVVLVCTVAFVKLAGERLAGNKPAEPAHGQAGSVSSDGAASKARAPDLSPPSGAGRPSVKSSASARSAASESSSSPNSRSASPDGGLVVTENGKEVFRMPSSVASSTASAASSPNRQASSDDPGATDAASVESDQLVQLPAESAENNVMFRVEPEYPESAREKGIQGPVVLDVHIRPNGAVKEARVMSGEAVLAQAAVEAVRQWRFKPAMVKGQPAEMQTQITLNFRLPR